MQRSVVAQQRRADYGATRLPGCGRWDRQFPASNGHGAYWTRAFADADDYDNSDGNKILTFYEAQDMPKQLARGGVGTSDAAPITVANALGDSEIDLKARHAAIRNARWSKWHLTSTLLAKPVQLLTTQEIRKCRDGLLAKATPINRVCNCVCAALELAAQHDGRIQNRDAWEVGLTGLPDAQRARNVVLSVAKVRAFIAAAYARVPRKLCACASKTCTTIRRGRS